MVWSSSCNTVAPIAHAVIMARWGTSWWAFSPDILAILLSSAQSVHTMQAKVHRRQTSIVRLAGVGGDGIVNLTSRGRVWAQGGDVGYRHAAIRPHVCSRQTLKAV